MRKSSFIKKIPFFTGMAIFLYLLGYVIPYNKGGTIAALGIGLITIVSFLLIIFLKRKIKEE